jgi:Putative peptidoglycan binding domain
MTVQNREDIVMTAIEQRHHRPDCRDVEVVDDRAATLAALSDELTQRLSKHPLPPRNHALERERSRWQPLWWMGLLSVLGVAIVGLAVTSSGMIWKELESFRGQPADTSPVASSIMTVSTAAAATAPPPQSAAPPIDSPIDPPTIASAPVHDRTTAAPPGDLQRVDDRELTWTEVHELQIRLRALKFDPGPIDGVKGPLTSGAVRRFQESQGDPATGDVGLRTLIRVRQATAAPE